MCYYIFSIYDQGLCFFVEFLAVTHHSSNSDVCQGPHSLCTQLDKGCMTTSLLGSADRSLKMKYRITLKWKAQLI